MVCNSCGTDIDEGAISCSACGAPVASAPTQSGGRRRAALVVILVAAIAGGVALLMTRNDSPAASGFLNTPRAAATASGCDAPQEFPSEGAQHVAQDAHVSYTTSPATSGSHAQPAQTGVHATPVPEVNVVHNLEHGHVILQYKEAVPKAIQEALEELARNAKTVIIAAPNAAMTPTIAFTGWQHLVQCTDDPDTYTDAATIRAAAALFIERFVGKGPEGRIPGVPATA